MAVTRKNAPGAASGFIAYYRVSTARQGESGLGLDAQRSSVLRYLQQAKGELLAEYTEIESGKKNDRPELAAAIRAAKQQKATLVIAKLDRLARNVAFISNLMESAADFVAVDMPHANRLTVHIMAAIAEHEREMISARTKAALQQLRARGTQLGNPRWQAALEKARAARKKAPRPAEIRSILIGYRSEGLTLQQAADRANSIGLKTPKGGKWHPNTVARALAA